MGRRINGAEGFNKPWQAKAIQSRVKMTKVIRAFAFPSLSNESEPRPYKAIYANDFSYFCAFAEDSGEASYLFRGYAARRFRSYPARRFRSYPAHQSRRLNPILEGSARSLGWLAKGPLFDPFKEGSDASGEDRNAPGARDFTIDRGGEAVQAADRQGAIDGTGDARALARGRLELAASGRAQRQRA
jgi:hypothetical protein